MRRTLPDFTLENTIGKGTFGKVKKARHIPTGHYAAVKILQKARIVNKKDLLRVQRERQILRQVSHPNILKLYQLDQSPKSYYIVTELVEGEQLFQKINRLGRLSEEMAAVYFMQLLDAELYLQRRGICHRDIKPENIIVRDDKLKLIDFGLSNYCRRGQWLHTSCGSPCYAAPEMMNQKQYDAEKTEVWALGVTLYAMLTGRLPFEHSNTQKLYKMMENSEYEEIADISSSLRSLVRAMIEVRPQLRICLQQIVEHIWVKSQRYEFYQQKPEREWNQQVLEQMCGLYNTAQSEMKERILGFGKEGAHYWMAEKGLESSQAEGFPLHRGAVHIGLIFYSLESIRQQIERTMPQAKWPNLYTASTATTRATIRKIGSGQLFYLHQQSL